MNAQRYGSMLAPVDPPLFDEPTSYSHPDPYLPADMPADQPILDRWGRTAGGVTFNYLMVERRGEVWIAPLGTARVGAGWIPIGKSPPPPDPDAALRAWGQRPTLGSTLTTNTPPIAEQETS